MMGRLNRRRGHTHFHTRPLKSSRNLLVVRTHPVVTTGDSDLEVDTEPLIGDVSLPEETGIPVRTTFGHSVLRVLHLYVEGFPPLTGRCMKIKENRTSRE